MPMSEKIAVFDPESMHLRRLPRNKIDGLLLTPMLLPWKDSKDHV